MTKHKETTHIDIAKTADDFYTTAYRRGVEDALKETRPEIYEHSMPDRIEAARDIRSRIQDLLK